MHGQEVTWNGTGSQIFSVPREAGVDNVVWATVLCVTCTFDVLVQ